MSGVFNVYFLFEKMALIGLSEVVEFCVLKKLSLFISYETLIEYPKNINPKTTTMYL